MLLSKEELRNYLTTTITKRAPYNCSIQQKKENISHFNELSRDGLQYNNKERRILLYRTLKGEKIFIQYPGMESLRVGKNIFPFDFRPIIQKNDGSYAPDMDFKSIWNTIDDMGRTQNGYLDILATLFLRIAYMIDYKHNENRYNFETIDVPSSNILENGKVEFVWNSFNIDNDIVETINDLFDLNCGISLEGFLYYNDLLAQNEDCKYYYLKGPDWRPQYGRINNCLSHLTIIAHLRGKMGISELLDTFQRHGVGPLKQNRLGDACGNLVVRV